VKWGRLSKSLIPLVRDILVFKRLTDQWPAGISSSWRQPQALDARFDKLFDFGHVLDLAPRQQLFPLDLGLLGRST
jgi:hypothetical protein